MTHSVPTGRSSDRLANWREMAIINLAGCALGLVINPIIPIYRDREVGFILKDAGSRLLFTPGGTGSFDYLAMAARIAAMTPSLEHIVTVRPGESEGATLSYAEQIGRASCRERGGP